MSDRPRWYVVALVGLALLLLCWAGSPSLHAATPTVTSVRGDYYLVLAPDGSTVGQYARSDTALASAATWAIAHPGQTATVRAPDYRVTAKPASTVPPVVPPVVTPPVATATAWLAVQPPAGAKVIYVSSSAGDDANPGTIAAPVKTLAKAQGLSDPVPTTTPVVWLLKRGDTWSGEVAKMFHPDQTMASYGADDAARPVIQYAAGGPGSLVQMGANNQTVADVDIQGVADPTQPKVHGLNAIRAVTDDFSNLLIQGVRVQGFEDNITIQAYAGAVKTTNPDGTVTVVNNPTKGITNVTLRHVVSINSFPTGTEHSQGLYASGIDGLLIEDCVFDHNGWRDGYQTAGWGGPTMFNHNIYIQSTCKDVVIRNTISARASSFGLQARLADGSAGSIRGNLVYGCGNGVMVQAGYQVRDNIIAGMIDRRPDAAGVAGWGLDLTNAAADSATNNLVAACSTPINAGPVGDNQVVADDPLPAAARSLGYDSVDALLDVACDQGGATPWTLDAQAVNAAIRQAVGAGGGAGGGQ